MSYSDFSLRELVEQFGLTTQEDTRLFPGVQPVQPSALLRSTLDDAVPLALALQTEKARSEMIIAPILLEVRRLCHPRISLFSGVEFNVDQPRGLSGFCDYLLARSPEQLFVRAPVLAIVEAKNDNVRAGYAQCTAEMIAAQIFNQRTEQQGPVYGAVTTGNVWRFLRLEGTQLTIDKDEYYIDRVDVLLGLILFICALSS
jgi:hypothetical protein